MAFDLAAGPATGYALAVRVHELSDVQAAAIKKKYKIRTFHTPLRIASVKAQVGTINVFSIPM